MKKRPINDLSNLSMLEIFQVEADTQLAVITDGLLDLGRGLATAQVLEALMRAAHSLKGAARIVKLDDAVSIAHAVEDCFVAAQQGKIRLGQDETDILFAAVDLLLEISKTVREQPAQRDAHHARRVHDLLGALREIAAESERAGPGPAYTPIAEQTRSAGVKPTNLAVIPQRQGPDGVLRLTTRNLNRLLGLAGESLVEARWLHPFADSMLRLKRLQAELQRSIDSLRDSIEPRLLNGHVGEQINETLHKAAECGRLLSDRLADLEMYDRRSANLAHRLYQEVLQCRMRPFGDCARKFPRMVRDLARDLGKEARLEIVGEQTQVDRDILEKLEAPLAHLLRNALDHGCETPEARQRAGKSAEAVVRIEARHSAGMLVVTVSDDGPGISFDELRQCVLQKQLTDRSAVEKLGEPELLEFLLAPGFTMKRAVTEISGRGVGLDVVHAMVRSVRGSIRIGSELGKGMRFQLNLPITLSVVRALLVEIAGEPYAMPLSQITQTLKLKREAISMLAGRPHFALGGQQIGLLAAYQVLADHESPAAVGEYSVVVLGDRTQRYGLVVDKFLGERELVVQALDSRLGKVKNISSGSLMEDGSPVLIVDVDELLHSIEELISAGSWDEMNWLKSDKNFSAFERSPSNE